MITLYHGSYTSVPSPLAGVGRRVLDFGPGFYVTSIREQAERWARRVCVIRAVDTPLLTTYEFNEEALPADVRRLRLEHYYLLMLLVRVAGQSEYTRRFVTEVRCRDW